MSTGRRGHRAKIAVACAPIALLSLHCTLVAGLDGFAGPPLRDEDASDGALDSRLANDDTGVEAASDSRVAEADALDTGVVVDSGSAIDTAPQDTDPNGPPTFVDGGTFCSGSEAGVTAFCEDFDRHDLSPTWIREGLDLRLTSYEPHSTPNDLLLEAPPSSNGGTWVSKITKAFGGAEPSIDLGVSIRPEIVDTGTAFLLVTAVEFTNADTKYSLRLVYLSGQTRLEESTIGSVPGSKDVYHAFFTLPTDTWTRVTMQIRLQGSSPTVDLALDGAPIYTKEPLTVPASIDLTPTVILGAVYGGSPHSGWTIRFDDLTVAFP